ncbi:hypothetical protein HOD29_03820 [archaeon]|jgi:hypothetical protein|nr:hypothetical protein [archaeon]
MIKQVYKRIKREDVGSKILLKKYGKEYFFYSHELEEGKFRVVLVIKNLDLNEINRRMIFSFGHFFNKRKVLDIFPIWTDYTKKIYFFKRNGDQIIDKIHLKELYELTWTHEFLYSKPFYKAQKGYLSLISAFHSVNKKRLKDFQYPLSENQKLKKIYEISEELDSSDLSMGGNYISFLEIALEC